MSPPLEWGLLTRAKGCLSDVLACVRELGKKEFSLNEMYGFVPKLQKLHPGNKHVPDKIRQQLQVLRDNDVLNFISPGKYKLKV